MSGDPEAPVHERVAGALLARLLWTWGGLAALTLALGSGLFQLEIRTDGAAIHPSGNAVVRQTLADREVFRDADPAIVLMTLRAGAPGAPASLESEAGLAWIAAMHESLAALPSVDASGVRSLATVLDPDPSVAIQYIDEFLLHVPHPLESDPGWLARLREFPLTHGLFLSASGRAAAFYVPVASGPDRAEFLRELEAWAAAERTDAFDLRLTGPVVAEVMLGRAVLGDLFRLVPILVAAIALLLFASLRTVGGVVIPLAEVLLVLVLTLGAMGHAGVPITLVTTILPVVLMTMAVTDEVHLLERFQARLADERGDETPDGDRARSKRAMLGAIRDVGTPIVLTSLSTAVGFLSFLSASMSPIREFGLFAALGIAIAMLLSFSFVPALAMLLPSAAFAPSRRVLGRRERLSRYEAFAVGHPRTAARVAVGTALVALPGLLGLTVQDSWIANFDPVSDVVSAERDFNDEFWGSYRLDVTLESDERRFFQHREGLALLERVRDIALAGPHVAGVESHLVAFETVARAIGEPGALSGLRHSVLLRIVPLVWTVREEIGLDQVLTWGAKSARARLYVDSADHRRAEALREHLDRELPAIVQPFDVRYRIGGELAIASEVVGSIVSNQLRSVGWALVGVGLLLWLWLRSAKAAGLLLVPLGAALVVVLGGMGWLGVDLGIATSMFSALALGVGVDFAVHLHHAYRRARAGGSAHAEALAESLRTSGRAIRWNATVLGLGFLVLTASELKPNASLGMLLAASIAACYGMTLLLAPELFARLPDGADATR